MPKIRNTYAEVSGYCTQELQRTLDRYAEAGYKLVSTEMAPNRHGVTIMYLFFTKEEE